MLPIKNNMKYIFPEHDMVMDLLAGHVVSGLAVSGEVDGAGRDVHVHDPVHDLALDTCHWSARSRDRGGWL